MELKKFIEKVKTFKPKNSLLDLTYNILVLEETLTEYVEPTREIRCLGEVLKAGFVLLIENKLEINNKENPDWDLDNWKNNIGKYRLKTKIDKEIYLYTLRNSTKNIIKFTDEKNDWNIKVFVFELLIKTFLYIDYVNLSIDAILENQLKTIPNPPKTIEKKEEKEIVEVPKN
jgi:hypothetical protein